MHKFHKTVLHRFRPLTSDEWAAELPPSDLHFIDTWDYLAERWRKSHLPNSGTRNRYVVPTTSANAPILVGQMLQPLIALPGKQIVSSARVRYFWNRATGEVVIRAEYLVLPRIHLRTSFQELVFSETREFFKKWCQSVKRPDSKMWRFDAKKGVQTLTDSELLKWYKTTNHAVPAWQIDYGRRFDNPISPCDGPSLVRTLGEEFRLSFKLIKLTPQGIYYTFESEKPWSAVENTYFVKKDLTDETLYDYLYALMEQMISDIQPAMIAFSRDLDFKVLNKLRVRLDFDKDCKILKAQDSLPTLAIQITQPHHGVKEKNAERIANLNAHAFDDTDEELDQKKETHLALQKYQQRYLAIRTA